VGQSDALRLQVKPPEGGTAGLRGLSQCLQRQTASNFVEAPITRETSVGLAVPTQNGSPQGVSQRKDPTCGEFSFLPIPEGNGSQKGRFMAVESQSIGVVRVTRQVLSTIVINTALQIPGVVRIAQASDQWSRLLGRQMLRQGVKLTVKDNTVTIDLYIVVRAGSNIVEVGTSLQEEIASALENMTGMQVREVNVYIQDVV